MIYATCGKPRWREIIPQRDQLAAEIKRGFPFSPRVRRMVDALTAGTGEGDQLGSWEFINERGEIENLLHPAPSLRVRGAVDEEI
jgi:hypothetical protein